MSHHHQHLPRAVVTTRLWAGENTMFSKALTFPSPRFDSIWVIGQPGRNGGTSRAGEAPGTSCLGSRVGPGAGGSPSRALAVPKQSDSASTCATCSLAPGIRVAGRALPRPRQHPPSTSWSPGTRDRPQQRLHSRLLSLAPQAPGSVKQIPRLSFPLTGGQKIGGPRLPKGQDTRGPHVACSRGALGPLIVQPE